MTVNGCTDSSASNYNPNATIDDGSCIHEIVTFDGQIYDACDGDNIQVDWNGYHNVYEVTQAEYADCSQIFNASNEIEGFHSSGHNQVFTDIAPTSGQLRFFVCTTHCTTSSSTAKFALRCAPRAGCTNSSAVNYDLYATQDDGSCQFTACNINHGGCDANAACTNTVSGASCTCNAGYAGDGLTCTDIDECNDGTANCDAIATCTNGFGTFTCTCPAGFSGDGTSCTQSIAPCIAHGQKIHLADGTLKAVEHVIPGDVVRTPLGSSIVQNVKYGRRLQHHMRRVSCGDATATITHDHAYYCENKWTQPQRLPFEVGFAMFTQPVVAIETENYCQDRLIMESGMEVETWDGRALESWRPHSYKNGERQHCALPGSDEETAYKVKATLRELHAN